ncbi:MAG TPA: hypothetical protein PKL57_14345, partial [Candidatus Wallbacteria bacterium]|nr:hypothetical protein [Candidatus Wallbacteria bacterium]
MKFKNLFIFIFFLSAAFLVNDINSDGFAFKAGITYVHAQDEGGEAPPPEAPPAEEQPPADMPPADENPPADPPADMPPADEQPLP